MSNNYSKQLSTEQITQKLDKLNYHFEDKYWSEFAQQYQGSRMQAVKMQAKFNPKFLAIPVGLIVIASIVYFSINNMRSENVNQEPIVAADEKLIPEVKQVEETSKQVVVATVKIDTVKPELPQSEVVKPVIIESASKEIINPEKKENTVNEEEKIVKDETARFNDNNNDEGSTSKKKKKKKKRGSIISNDAFTPSAEEDNIVIPEN